MNIAIKYARLPNGLVYFYQHWIPKDPRALIVFIHGLGDHIGRLGECVQHFARLGYACALYDARGHGRTSGRRGHIDRFTDWVDDLASFIHFSQSPVPGDTPTFLVGISLGALVGINYLLTHATPVSGMVAISTAIVPTVHIPEWKMKAADLMVRFLPKLSVYNGVSFEALTRDDAELDALRNDSFFHRRITLGAAYEFRQNLEIVMAMPHRIHIPMLMLAGSDDCICDSVGTLKFASRLTSADKTHHIYPGMKHDLLHDIGRERVLGDMEKWIAERSVCRRQPDRQFSFQRREVLWENVSSLS